MMNLSRFFSFFLFLINMISVVYADKYYFEQISLNEGLSQSTVKIIYRDRTGMLWVGTKEGLNGYDSQSIHTYYHDTEQEHSLSDNNIFFTEDVSGVKLSIVLFPEGSTTAEEVFTIQALQE